MTRTRWVYINLAVFSVGFVVMLGWAVRSIVSVGAIDRPYELAAEFPNAFGVLPNAEVTYLGVSAGQVKSVKLVPGGVRVRMTMQRESKIPVDSSASIFRKSAIGEPYVDFSPPSNYDGTGGPYYRKGTVVPMARTTVPLEFSELLRSASALIAAVPPESVATLLEEAAAGLEGRTDSLRQLTESGDELSATLAERTAALDRLATNNTRLTRVVTEHRDSLGQSITDLRNVAASLRAAKGDLSLLLDQGSQLLGQTGDLVAKHKGDLDCDLKVLEHVTDALTTPEQLAGLRALLQIGPRAFNGVWDSRDLETTGPHPGPWVRVGFLVNPVLNPPLQHTPPKELPAPRPIAACASALQASGPGYRPLATTSRGSSLPSTGGNALLGLGMILLGASVVLRRAQVRTAAGE